MATTSPTLLEMTGVPPEDGLTNGTHWVLGSDRTLTWAISNAGAGDFAWSSFGSQVMRDAVSTALEDYAEVANVRFRYTNWYDDVTSAPADLVVTATLFPGLHGMNGNYYARAYFPNETLTDREIAARFGTSNIYPNAAGDVVLNFTNREMSSSDYAPGGTGFFAVLHELGHALGLKHPHDNGGVSGRPTFAQMGISPADTQRLTIMSYDPTSDLPDWFRYFGLPATYGYPETLMPFDVIALQRIYGPNTSTRTGNDTYSLFNDDTISTAWDAGGHDLLTASGSAYGWRIQGISTGGQSSIALAIPYDSTAITGKYFFNVEDFTGSQYNDSIVGTDLSNTISGLSGNDLLVGGAGNDRIVGGTGADFIDGGSGTDTSVYREAPRADYLVSRRSDGTVEISTRAGTSDRNAGIESIEFSESTVATSSMTYLPGFTAVPSSAVQPVFRFYNSRDKAYFYTTSAAERELIIRESTDPSFNPASGVWPYFYQGTTFEQAHSSNGSTPVFRFYNTNTGHHFFTTSLSERDMVVRESTDPSFGQPGLWPYRFEGEALRAFGEANHLDAKAVFRLYSPALDRHFFTASVEESNEIKLTGQWVAEGIGYWGEIPG